MYSIRCHDQRCRTAVPYKVLREGWNHLEWNQGAVILVVAVAGDRAVQFVHNVSK